MKQLSASDRTKVMNVLAKCAAETKDITDAGELNEAVYKILHKEFPGQPQLIKRACQAYNSAKSLHKLSSSDDSTRGDDFSILNPNEMYERAKIDGVTSSLSKAASAIGLRSAVFTKDPEVPMAKAASATSVKKSTLTDGRENVPELSAFQVKHINNENLRGFESCITKFASQCNQVARTFEKSKKEFITKMASESSASRRFVAEILHARYGEAGDALVDEYNKNTKINKVANYNKNKYRGSVQLPDSEICKKASACIEASENLRRTEDRGFLMLDMMLPCLKDMISKSRITKEAAMPAAGSIIGTALGIGAAKDIPELVGLDDPDEAATRKAIYTTELHNRLKEHGLRRAFMDLLLDPSIQKYPLDKILTAYNISLKEAPLSFRSIPDTANLGLLKARTLALLGRGGVPSAGDADTIMNIQKVYGKIDPSSLTTDPQAEIA